MPSQVELRALIAPFVARHMQVRAASLAGVLSAWDALGSWREPDIDVFAARAALLVEAAQVEVAAVESVWQAVLASAVTGGGVSPVAVPAAVATGARDVAAVDVYRRLGPDVWRRLASGTRLDDAVSAARSRAARMVETDVQLARTHAARYVASADTRVVGFRRVLTGSSSCALCVIASTQRYRRGDLVAIHPGCDCAVAPIYGDVDPGQVINPDTLDDLQDRIAEQFGETDASGRTIADFRQLVVTHEHGEMGPVLARRRDSFTGPDDI